MSAKNEDRVGFVAEAAAIADIAAATKSSGFIAEAEALLRIAHAVDGMSRERACAVLCAAAAMHGHYEEAIRFARCALEARLEAQIEKAKGRRR